MAGVSARGATGLLSLPAPLTQYAGQDGWLAALVGIPFGLIPLAAWYVLDRRLPGRSFTEQARAFLGPVGGSLLAVLPVVLFATTLAATGREVVDVVLVEGLPRTPLLIVLPLLLLPPLYAVRSGLEALARLGEVMVPLGIGMLLMILLVSFKEMQPLNLRPFLASGWRPVWQGAAAPAAFYAESFFFLYILPQRGRDRAATLRAAAAGVVTVAVLLALSTAITVAIFGPLGTVLPAPVFQGTRVVSIAEFFTHLDSVLVVSWLAMSMVKIGVFLYCFCFALGQLLGMRDYRPLTLPAGAFTVISADQWFPSTSTVSHWLTHSWPFWGGVMELLPPLALAAAALVRRLPNRGERA